VHREQLYLPLQLHHLQLAPDNQALEALKLRQPLKVLDLPLCELFARTLRPAMVGHNGGRADRRSSLVADPQDGQPHGDVRPVLADAHRLEVLDRAVGLKFPPGWL
jgi:hypothetical protein